MHLLVFNCGSSSLNYKLFSATPGNELQVICKGKAHRVGVKGSEPAFIEHQCRGETFKTTPFLPDHRKAASLVLDFIRENGLPVDAIGHRFVHGGSKFQTTTRLDDSSLAGLQTCLPLAPIHNPNSMSVIAVCRERLPALPQYVTFDTAFHASLPECSYRYALPASLSEGMGLRKYGFHGLSYRYVTRQAAAFLGRPLDELDLVACHLGTGGSSAAAIRQGRSIDTSMGYSPLAGLMMSTRTGDLDPLLPLDLMEQMGFKPEQLDEILNTKSGLLGVSGLSSDIRDLIRAGHEGNDRAALAVKMYTYRLRKAIGAYITLLGGIDALIFTDDIGVQNPLVRAEACREMEWCGVALDPTANQQAAFDRISDLSRPGAGVRVLSIPTDEELVIAQEGYQLLQEDRDA
jgi:acetate kinase